MTPLSDFTVRGTTVYVQSEELELAELPTTRPSKATKSRSGASWPGWRSGRASL